MDLLLCLFGIALYLFGIASLGVNNLSVYFGKTFALMAKRGKKIFMLIGVLILAGIGYGVYVWNKPHRDVTDEKGIAISAAAIFDSFTVNEARANVLYLNKAIQVTGEVSEVKKNQDGQTVVYLKTADPVFGVNCSFKEDPGSLQKGTTITFKGICTGYLSDVIINQGIIVKE